MKASRWSSLQLSLGESGHLTFSSNVLAYSGVVSHNSALTATRGTTSIEYTTERQAPGKKDWEPFSSLTVGTYFNKQSVLAYKVFLSDPEVPFEAVAATKVVGWDTTLTGENLTS